MIGATSPCTLFFTPANDLGYVTNQILFDGNNDRPFDGDYNPLYKRDADFVRYLVWLSKQPGFADGYTEVSTYFQLFYHCELTQAQYDALVGGSVPLNDQAA